jgi:hypothetical protein
MNEKIVFRTSALLYADNNYEVSTSRIIKKLIESVFIEITNITISIDKLIDYSNEFYTLSFEHKEFYDVIVKYANNFSIVQHDADIVGVSLTDKRYTFLLEKLAMNNIDGCIKKFIKEFDYTDDAENTIYKFLHNILNTNVMNFSKIVDKNSTTVDLDQGLNSFSGSEIEMLNSFLSYDCDEKNKALFDIISYSLEYCMLTGDGENIYEQGLVNKNMYLDTNIIFRAIGINGESRKNRTELFLKKCAISGQIITISKYSIKEFMNTIDDKLKNLVDKYSNSINDQIYYKYSHNEDINLYYLKWRSGKRNPSVALFKAHIMNEYKKLLNEFKIKEDYQHEISETDKKNLGELVSSLQNYKNKHDPLGTDAKNILLIRHLRKCSGSINKKLIENPYFMISTDYALMKYCIKEFEEDTVISILPSHWYTILLRYASRTDDDLSSFISFLNLRNTEKLLDGDLIYSILAGISELVSDINDQEYYAKEIISKGVDDIVKSKTLDKAYEETKEFVNRDLEKRIHKVESEMVTLNQSSEDKDDITTFEKTRNKKLIELQIKKEIKRWKQRRVTVSIVFILILVGIIINLICIPNKCFAIIDSWLIDRNSRLLDTVVGTIATVLTAFPGRVLVKTFDVEVVKHKEGIILKKIEKDIL